MCICLVLLCKAESEDLMANIPLEDYGGDGELIHFAHANAYPPGAYKQLLVALNAKYKVVAIIQKPLQKDSEYQKFNSWEELADDIISSIEALNVGQVIGMGHSLGAVATILAAYKRPELFSRLVLIDPVLFPKSFDYLGMIIPVSLRANIIPIARKALKRKTEWYSKENAFSAYRDKEVFRRFSDEALWDYIHAGLVTDEKTSMQVLKFTKEWEARIYSTVQFVMDKLYAIEIPIYAVRGDETNVIKKELWDTWKGKQTHNHYLNIAFASHLVPMEYPEVISKWLLEHL